MSMGKRNERQEALFVTAENLPKSAGHPFYVQLNRLLAEAEFDRWIERRCQRYYEQTERRGRPSLPPGVFFRMLLVGYFEGLDSQRGIAWRCADSLSLRQFLGIPLDEDTPDHSTLTLTRKRLPPEVFDEMFQFVLSIAVEKKLLNGRTVGVDSTMIEADAAMKSIVRRDTGEDWREYVTRLMREDGTIAAQHEPTAEEVRRYDKKRKKTAGNDDWEAPNDPDARITQMKDGRTHLAYKAEHVVDLESELVVAAEIRQADEADSQTLADSVLKADENLQAAGHDRKIEEAAADKGYHSAEQLELCQRLGLRTYIPEPRQKHRRTWADKPAESQHAVVNNRRRVRGEKSRKLQRLRSERVERSFAHVCDTGGARRSWLHGLVDVTKRYLIAVAAHNLGRIMRRLFAMGKPKTLQKEGPLAALLQLLVAWFYSLCRAITRPTALPDPSFARRFAAWPYSLTSTGCYAESFHRRLPDKIVAVKVVLITCRQIQH
jgi:transposase